MLCTDSKVDETASLVAIKFKYDFVYVLQVEQSQSFSIGSKSDSNFLFLKFIFPENVRAHPNLCKKNVF